MGRPKNYVRKDDRELAEIQEYFTLVVGHDTFMSGWGGASKGASVAAWACREQDVSRVLKWAKARGDLKRIKVVEDRGGYRMFLPPQGTAHFHIYIVRPGHPALAAPVLA